MRPRAADPSFGENLFGFFMTRFGQQHRVGFFIFRVIARHFNHTLAIGRFFAEPAGSAMAAAHSSCDTSRCDLRPDPR